MTLARIVFAGRPPVDARSACRALAERGSYFGRVLDDIALHGACASSRYDDARDALSDAALLVAWPGADGAVSIAQELGVPVWLAAEEHAPPAWRTAPNKAPAKENDTMTAPAVAPPAHQFMWIDLETTGLDPANGVVLEFAVVLCEDARGDNFAPVAQYAGAVHHDAAALDKLPIDDFVKRMHDKNGLWADVAASTTTLADVDAFLAALAASLGGKPRGIVIAGSSVHFDRAWIRQHMPAFDAWLSHRVFDVTTLRRAVEAWGPAVEWPKRDAHRALADVLATIQEARVARAALFGGAP